MNKRRQLREMIEDLVTFREVSNPNKVFDQVINVACSIFGILLV